MLLKRFVRWPKVVTSWMEQHGSRIIGNLTPVKKFPVCLESRCWASSQKKNPPLNCILRKFDPVISFSQAISLQTRRLYLFPIYYMCVRHSSRKKGSWLSLQNGLAANFLCVLYIYYYLLLFSIKLCVCLLEDAMFRIKCVTVTWHTN